MRHVGGYQALLTIVKDMDGMTDSELALPSGMEPSEACAGAGDAW